MDRVTNRRGRLLAYFIAALALAGLARNSMRSVPWTVQIGSERVGGIFGTVFVFHQLGGATAAITGGWARVHFGDYQYAFLIGGCLGLIAACLALTIDRRDVEKVEIHAEVELVGA